MPSWETSFWHWNSFLFTADAPLIQMFLLCLTHCYLCPLRFGSKQMGQEPCALGSGCPILILRAVVSLPSVSAREKGCKDKFLSLAMAVGHTDFQVTSEGQKWLLRLKRSGSVGCLEKEYSLWGLLAHDWVLKSSKPSNIWHRAVC